MSYCLNPQCQKPQNTPDTKFCLSCGAKLLLSDRYRAIKAIAQGGFGRTFLAIDEYKPSKPECVIKQFFPLIHPGNGNTDKAAELFQQEAVRLDQLGNHPQIPELFAYFTQDNRQYLIQEFIDGQNLAEELEKEGCFNETKIRQLLNDMLPVLQFIHAGQVIHRDIKPENIIRRISPQTPGSNQAAGNLVLVDFGAAKIAIGNALLKTGTTIGSPEYLAPEQGKGKAVFASDLYSLGVTCIHLLTQVSPFELFDSQEDTWIWRDFLKDNPVSDRLANILDKLIQNAINRRYQSVAEVINDLNQNSVSISIFNSLPKIQTQTWKCIYTLTGHSNEVLAVAFSPNGEIIASGSSDDTIKLWQFSTGKLIRTLSGHTNAIYSLAFSPNGEILASSSWDNTIKLWDSATGKLISTLEGWFFGHTNAVYAIVFSPDGKTLASGSDDQTIKLWQIPSGKLIRTLSGHLNTVYTVSFSPDGKTLASGSYDNTIKLWHTSNGKLKFTLTGHSNSVRSVNYNFIPANSPDTEVLATGSIDKTIKLWDTLSGKVIRTLSGHSDYVNSVVFSPNGQILASCSNDKTINIWQPVSGTLIDTLIGHLGSIHSISFSPDSKILASASADKTIKLWQLCC